MLNSIILLISILIKINILNSNLINNFCSTITNSYDVTQVSSLMFNFHFQKAVAGWGYLGNQRKFAVGLADIKMKSNTIT